VDAFPQRLTPDRVWVIDGTTGSRALPELFPPPGIGFVPKVASACSRRRYFRRVGGNYRAELQAPARGEPTCRPREIRELTGFGREPNITAEQGRALS
jgi:hypothetical protein